MSKLVSKAELETALKNLLEKTTLIENEEKNQGRDYVVSFKASAAEKEQLLRRCSGLTVSDYIRARLFDYPLARPKVIVPQVNREFLYELKCIGADIHQQTKAIYTALSTQDLLRGSDFYQYLLSLNELQSLLERVRSDTIAALLTDDSED